MEEERASLLEQIAITAIVIHRLSARMERTRNASLADALEDELHRESETLRNQINDYLGRVGDAHDPERPLMLHRKSKG